MKKTPIAVIVCLLVLPVSNYVHAQQGQKVTVSEILGERNDESVDWGMTMGITFIIGKK